MDHYINKSIPFLIFSINKETFAIEVSKVIEVLRKQEIFPVPKTQKYIEGIINFRGDVLTVINTQKKINLQQKTQSEKFVIIVLDLEFGDKKVSLGAIADKVMNVIEISEKDMKPVPEFGNYYNPEFLKGAFKLKDEFVIIMDIEKIFSTNDVEIINHISKKNKK